MAARAETGQASALIVVMWEDQKEALFKRFSEWQRAKGP
jgi:hypothetical protein